jgi:SAM-dependent methyltransferase
MSNTWLSFWQEKNAFDESMSINYAYFLKKIEKYVQLTKQTRVLDLGSGPGHLEDAWFDRVKEIHAVDVSARYNTIVRANHKDHPNVFVHDLRADDYLNFSMLSGMQFDVKIVMSVLQYYRNKDEVVELLKQLRQVAAPGSKLFLCDLMVKASFLKEILQIMKDAFKEGKLLSIISLFFKLRFSSYYKIKKESGFLILSDQEWLDIFQGLGLNATFLSEPITLQKNRKNVVVQF